ncbi:hypothetical protein [Escherichia coli]|uniref:hypothetical protein n=1 Tax=Escherichia coli TaxID=562 RepID=UPI00373AE14E
MSEMLWAKRRHTVTFVDKTKSNDNNNVFIKKLPDNILQGVVINFAMGAGLRRDNKKGI